MSYVAKQKKTARAGSTLATRIALILFGAARCYSWERYSPLTGGAQNVRGVVL